jgi:nucleoside-diphosphate-sugar epimerase
VRTVVVGASGFLGAALVDGLRGRQQQVLGVGRRPHPRVDIVAEAAILASLLRDDDVVVNAAGVGIKDASGPVALIADNLRVATDVARACAAAGARLVHISSGDIWPLAERANADEGSPVVPDSPYGLSKLMAELALSDLARRSGLRHVVARPTYVVGPGMFENRLFPAVLRQIEAGSVRLTGDPEATTDYLFIDDFLRAIDIMIARAPFGGACFHVASGRLSTLAETAGALVAAAGAQASIVFEDVRTGPRQEGCLSTRRIASLGFVPTIDLARGCQAFVAARRRAAGSG